MSRQLSPAAIKAFFSPDGDENLICLLTLSGANLSEPIRLADGYTQRLSETDDDVLYGVVSRTNSFIFLPFEIHFPSEEAGAGPRVQITIHNATRMITPQIRNLTSPPAVKLEFILASAVDVVEADFDGMTFNGITYNANTVTGHLSMDMLALEPFPTHTFTPSYFPGIF